MNRITVGYGHLELKKANHFILYFKKKTIFFKDPNPPKHIKIPVTVQCTPKDQSDQDLRVYLVH